MQGVGQFTLGFMNLLKVKGEWMKQHNVQVIKLRKMRWVGHVACMVESRGMYRDVAGKPEGKMPFGRPRCGWEDNNKMDI